jgi:hypothetical protein
VNRKVRELSVGPAEEQETSNEIVGLIAFAKLIDPKGVYRERVCEIKAESRLPRPILQCLVQYVKGEVKVSSYGSPGRSIAPCSSIHDDSSRARCSGQRL